MKFVIGLLVGGLGTLAIATAASFDWQPPSRLDTDLFESAAVPAKTISLPATPQKRSDPQPFRSVTIDPLPAEPPEDPAPSPVDRGNARVVNPVVDTVQASPEPPVIKPVATSPATELAPAVVWKPFHSEVSAQGFARRLSTQLGYPFRALREGPAKYHVVFDYESDQQRELLRQQVQAITGFSSS